MMELREPLFNYSEDELHRLFLRCYPRLLSYARNMLGKGSAAGSDLINDVFYKFIRNRTPLQKEKAEAYLYAMLRNECLNLLKKQKVERNIGLDEIAVLQRIDNIATRDFFAASPERTLDHIVVEDVLSFSKELPPRTGEVFRLSRIEGLKNHEIARELEITQRAVEKHISLSIARYREAFLSKKRG